MHAPLNQNAAPKQGAQRRWTTCGSPIAIKPTGRQLGEDLLSFETPVLVLGDPAQLPPIEGGGYFTDAEPDVMLTEIHRQAAGDPIIELSRHVTRHQFNARIRRLLDDHDQLKLDRGHPELPVVGDRVICRRNRYDERGGIFNGSIWQVVDVEFVTSGGMDVAFMKVRSLDGDERETVAAVPVAWFTEAEESEELNDDSDLRRMGLDAFKSTYALTAHSAQGSQWDSVLVIDEGFCFREHRHRWRYTAATRAMRISFCGLNRRETCG